MNRRRWDDEPESLVKDVAVILFLFFALYVAMIALVVR